jgi:hypothetical protein
MSRRQSPNYDPHRRRRDVSRCAQLSYISDGRDLRSIGAGPKRPSAEFFPRPLLATNVRETLKIPEIQCRHFRLNMLRSFTGSFNLQLPLPSLLQLLLVR